ncbi:BBE domain-containing protein [Pantoea sp.]|uniref:BBE domain-containing protein n=1 Tax=Pantoea sp. TaxID=69393 RepID=UPI00289BE7B1|nr:BBE domain-containing protein [Pantoea sp.]
MSNYVVIDNLDTRFETVKRGFNLRWPESENKSANYVYVCKTADEVIAAANYALAAKQRITVRSGGHCYEGFVSNKLAGEESTPLGIIDLNLMTGMDYQEDKSVTSPYDNSATPEKYKFRAATGNQNWDGYVTLFKLANRTVPGGSCYSVGSGGHVSGGGYGLLSRLHGLTVDWLSGVDILVPNSDGTQLIAKHVNLNSTGSDRDLFIACRGAGGGNFGIILNYYYEELPQAPQQVYLLTLSYPWSGFASKDQFGRFLKAYWQWFSDNDANWNSSDISKANGGLFALLKLQHRSTGNINLLVQYTGKDGRVDGANQSAPFVDFVNAMNAAAGVTPDVIHTPIYHGALPVQPKAIKRLADPVQDAQLMTWLNATQNINGSGENQRGKYKSCYQVGNFTGTEITALWNNLNGADNPLLNQALVQIDSYGGAINTNDETSNPTSVYQRKSLLKSQFQVYWKKPEQDAACIAWIRKLYGDFFADQGGKPYEDETGRYEGCYINYPDIDMKYMDSTQAQIDPEWLTLHYGDKYQKLVSTKRAVDPKNIFRHEMSIPTNIN